MNSKKNTTGKRSVRFVPVRGKVNGLLRRWLSRDPYLQRRAHLPVDVPFDSGGKVSKSKLKHWADVLDFNRRFRQWLAYFGNSIAALILVRVDLKRSCYVFFYRKPGVSVGVQEATLGRFICLAQVKKFGRIIVTVAMEDIFIIDTLRRLGFRSRRRTGQYNWDSLHMISDVVKRS